MKAIRLLLLGVLVSCGERTPTAVNGDALLFGLPIPAARLLRCTSLSADSASGLIGPEGGVIVVGSHRLVVPAGALDTAVSITAVAPADTVNRVTFTPQGLTFHQPASLTMSYANCGFIAQYLPKQIAYVSDGQVILELLPALDDQLAQQVTARLQHFSDYAIAW